MAACAGADEADDVPSFAPPGVGGSGQQAAPPSGVSGAGAQAPGVGGAESGRRHRQQHRGERRQYRDRHGRLDPGGVDGAAGSATVNGGTGGGEFRRAPRARRWWGAGNGNVPPPAGAGPGRVGAELCPPGPFGTPLAAAPTVRQLFTLDDDGFFNFEGPVWTGTALYFSEIGGGNNPPPSRINRYVSGRRHVRAWRHREQRQQRLGARCGGQSDRRDPRRGRHFDLPSRRRRSRPIVALKTSMVSASTRRTISCCAVTATCTSPIRPSRHRAIRKALRASTGSHPTGSLALLTVRSGTRTASRSRRTAIPSM